MYSKQISSRSSRLNRLSGVSSSAYLGAAGNYGVLYIVGSGSHNLQITNVTLGANIGVGSAVGGNGVGDVSFNGPRIITGRLDFAPGQTNQFSNNNSSNVGPASVNTNVATVTSAISAVTSLNSALAGLGTNITINGTQTINESAGQLDTINTVGGPVQFRIFNVTSYSENNGNLVTINGDGSGDPVVFNFGSNTGNINLGGDVALTGNGLSDDKVIWNFTSSNQHIQLNNNASSFPNVAFHGIILAPNDVISLVNANLSGRVFGGDSQDMQIVSGDTIHAPVLNTATVTASNVTFDSDDTSSASITITGSTFKTSNLTSVGTPKTATNQLTIPLTNNGSTNVVLTGMSITWPSATDGNLQQVTLGGNVVVDGGTNGIATDPYSHTSLSGTTSQRTIASGATTNLVFKFKNNIVSTGYTITLSFSDGSTLDITV